MCHSRASAQPRVLTLRQAIPHVQPVVLAVALSHQQGIVLEVKGQEREGDVHVGRGDDHVGALQVVGVLIREARGFDHAGGAGEIAEAEFRPCEDMSVNRCLEDIKQSVTLGEDTGVSNRYAEATSSDCKMEYAITMFLRCTNTVYDYG